MPRHFKTAEQVYQQLAVFDYRENRDIEMKVEQLSKMKQPELDPIEKGTQETLQRITAQEFSVLADYTIRRKIVLDLLQIRLGYKTDGRMNYHAEEALHSFVVPMRITNTDIHVDDHNLWTIDDKLTYYEYLASDKRLKETLEKSNSLDRPDVILFSGSTAYHRPGTDQPVVII